MAVGQHRNQVEAVNCGRRERVIFLRRRQAAPLFVWPLIVWWLYYNKMRGEKIITLFLLLALVHTQWIVEQQAGIDDIPASLVIESDTPLPPPLQIIEVHPQLLPEEKQQEIVAGVAQQKQTPVAFPQVANPFDKSVGLPHDQMEKHGHPGDHKSKHGDRKHNRHQKRQQLREAGPQTRNEGKNDVAYQPKTVEQEDGYQGIVFLVGIGALCLIMVKACMRTKKCAIKKARVASPIPQQINMQHPIVITGQNQAIDEAIRFHETQIAMLRNSASRRPPTYHVYQ